MSFGGAVRTRRFRRGAGAPEVRRHRVRPRGPRASRCSRIAFSIFVNVPSTAPDAARDASLLFFVAVFLVIAPLMELAGIVLGIASLFRAGDRKIARIRERDLECLLARGRCDPGHRSWSRRSAAPQLSRLCRRRNSPPLSHGKTRGLQSQPVRGRRSRSRRAAAARRPAAADDARGRGRAGPSAGAGRRAHPHARHPHARLADLLGPARNRQDHGGAAAGRRHRAAFRADLRDLHRRRRPQEGVRRGAGAPRDRAGHAAVRRRDPPLQPRAAGLVPAGDGGRHHRAGRRHHRESVVRAELAAAVPRARAGVQIARRRGDREADGARRDDRRQAAAARRGRPRVARPHGRWRRPRRARR